MSSKALKRTESRSEKSRRGESRVSLQPSLSLEATMAPGRSISVPPLAASGWESRGSRGQSPFAPSEALASTLGRTHSTMGRTMGLGKAKASFRGVKEQRDLVHATTPLPDITQWSKPQKATHSVAYTMKKGALDDRQRYHSPFRQRQSKLVPLCSETEPAWAISAEIDHFEREKEEREAIFEREGLSDVLGAQPVSKMMMLQFRQHVCQSSSIFKALRKIPLNTIERHVRELRFRHLGFNSLVTFLVRLIGDTFSRSEAAMVFQFFDANEDNVIDFKELCTGMVMILSKDGPLVAVLHRCVTLARPKGVRDTRLSILTRFELESMVTVIRTANKESLDGGDIDTERFEAVEAALDRLLGKFAGNRMGEFPYNDLREYIRTEPVLNECISHLKVPRDPELYDSQMSNFIRTNDAEEGRTSLKLQKHNPLARIGSQSPRGNMSPRGRHSHIHMDAEIERLKARATPEYGNPEFFSLNGALFRRMHGGEPQQFT